jgi:hypothetical protein
MPKYLIEIPFTAIYSFTVEADDAEEAEEKLQATKVHVADLAGGGIGTTHKAPSDATVTWVGDDAIDWDRASVTKL